MISQQLKCTLLSSSSEPAWGWHSVGANQCSWNAGQQDTASPRHGASSGQHLNQLQTPVCKPSLICFVKALTAQKKNHSWLVKKDGWCRLSDCCQQQPALGFAGSPVLSLLPPCIASSAHEPCVCCRWTSGPWASW